MPVRKYNFRYKPERERFLDDIISDWNQIHSEEGAVVASGLRIVFDIGDYTSSERKKHVQKGEFRGIRSFRDLDALRRFLDSNREGGSGISWGRQNIAGIPMKCRVARYTRQGKRVVGEKTFQSYEITSSQK